MTLAAFWWRAQPARQSGQQFVLGFSLCLTITIIASYHLLVHDLSLLVLPVLLLAEMLLAGEVIGPARRILISVSRRPVFNPLYAVLQFWLREMNLMVLAVAMFATGIAIALISKQRQQKQEHLP